MSDNPPSPDIPVKTGDQPSSSSITVTTETIVSIPRKDKRWGIRKDDWNHLKSNINRCNQPISQYSRIMDISIGVFFTTLVTIIALFGSNNQINNVVYTALICVLASSTLFAIAFFYVSRRESEKKKSEISDVEEYMKSIEESLTEIG